MGLISTQLIDNRRGILCILGAFLIQLCAGGFHGTFGNMLPYLTSYMRQVFIKHISIILMTLAWKFLFIFRAART